MSHARRVYGVNGEVPDSYVKCYLRDGDKWLHKRKTRVVRRTTEPHFKQTLKYQVSETVPLQINFQYQVNKCIFCSSR